MQTYIATIAVPAAWFAGDRIVQFEFEYPKGKPVTHEVIQQAARKEKRWKKFSAISAIPKN
jgi:hypothetical protein